MTTKKYPGCRLDYDRTPSLPPKVEIVFERSAAKLAVALEHDQYPIVPFEIRQATVSALVAAANDPRFSQDAETLHRAALILAGRG